MQGSVPSLALRDRTHLLVDATVRRERRVSNMAAAYWEVGKPRARCGGRRRADLVSASTQRVVAPPVLLPRDVAEVKVPERRQ